MQIRRFSPLCPWFRSAPCVDAVVGQERRFEPEFMTAEFPSPEISSRGKSSLKLRQTAELFRIGESRKGGETAATAKRVAGPIRTAPDHTYCTPSLQPLSPLFSRLSLSLLLPHSSQIESLKTHRHCNAVSGAGLSVLNLLLKYPLSPPKKPPPGGRRRRRRSRKRSCCCCVAVPSCCWKKSVFVRHAPVFFLDT